MIQTYVDIHSHILPCVDDGAQSLEESMAMLEMAYAEGVRTIIATPHYGMPSIEPDLADCAAKVEELNARIRVHGSLNGLKIILGNELLYHSGISKEIIAGQARTLGFTDFVLVEFYENSDITVLEACAREMRDAGYKPIFAHAERYQCLRNMPGQEQIINMNRINALKNEGVLIQVNAYELFCSDPGPEPKVSGIKGLPFFKKRRMIMDEMTARSGAAWELVLSGAADFLASDAHREKYRIPIMNGAIKRIEKYASSDIAQKMIINAQILG